MLAIHGMNSGISSNDALFAARIVLLTPPPPYQAALAASAQAFEAPIPINGPTLLTTRTLNPVVPSDPPTTVGGGTGAVPNGTGWSAVRREVFLPGAVAASVENVVVSEIHYHPSPPTAAEIAAGFLQANDFEFIRITNKGTQPVNLTGVRFLSGVSFSKGLDLQSWLAPGASGVVVENAAAYQFRYGSHWPVIGEYDGALDDGGENLMLVGSGNLVIADLLYDDQVPWPGSADSGKSLLYTGGDPASGSSWVASLDAGGSGVSSFADFQKRYFPGGGAAAGAAVDADGDGVGNFVEYILGTDPLIANPGDASPLIIDSTQPLKLHANCRKGAAGGIRMTLQRSVGLQGWVDAGVEPSIIAVSPELNRMEWVLPAAAGGGFFRLNLSVQ
ncbi:MAG: hypothetical protein JWL81_389, partial [Verrucomicrobiales bacterium]|nr:hypothetical protein [Verrucomicrobiales bacterium]